MQVTEVLHKKILLLSANPISTIRLRTDEEMREIEESLKRATKRELFSIQTSTAVTYRDIRRAILDYQPNIVQFSGHGEGEEGLIFEDNTGESKLVSDRALAGLFELFTEQVECVFLNACYSQVQAEAIVKHIPYVIGMSQEISDKAAIEFATGFYDALGAGKTFDSAFKFGCNGILMADIPEELTPQLLKKSSYENCELNSGQVAISEEFKENNKKKRVCNLLFEYEEDKFSKIQAIQSTLREIVGDDSITIVDIEKGSIKLILQGSQAGLERLEKLFKSGELQELLDVPVEDVSFVDKQFSDECNQINKCKKLAFTIAADVSQEEISDLKNKLVKVSKESYEVQRKNRLLPSTLDNVLIQGLIEAFIDGVLIVTTEGELVHGNESARLICQQIAPKENTTNAIPQQVWHVCEMLLECSKSYPNQPLIIDWELPSSSAEIIRIRARWFELDILPKKCILVTLENQNQSLESLALSEVKAYGLTPREVEVLLLRRANYAYREIASQLFISLNTVKKHLKNIDLKIMFYTELETLLLGKGMEQAKVIKL